MAELRHSAPTLSTDWQIGMSSPAKAIEYSDTFIAFGRPAQALSLLHAAVAKFPEDTGLRLALSKAQALDQELVAARNGPPLLLTIPVIGFLLWCCSFAIYGLTQAPWKIKPVFAILLAFMAFGCYAATRHAIARWRMGKQKA